MLPFSIYGVIKMNKEEKNRKELPEDKVERLFKLKQEIRELNYFLNLTIDEAKGLETEINNLLSPMGIFYEVDLK